jgi:imidazolonepropionase-like amidohydrolase
MRCYLTLLLLVAPILAQDHPFETDAERVPSLVTGGSALVRGATIHTATGPAFVGSVLVQDGKIALVQEGDGDLPAPEGTLVIDGTGKHLAPGVVDTHSHTAIERGVNEGSVSISAEVTIADVIDPDDLSIYRALAGGVTTIRQLHGSANAIGGRDSVLKLHWHVDADALRFEGAQEGIKFALGENPKRSRSRFPNTRMGIERVYYRAFERAREYQREWRAYGEAMGRGEDPAPPRRDVRLDVLVGILEQSVIVHSHCYRADEILMLIRASQHFGFRIGTLQHVLEGYKVAFEMAAAGVPGSAFADWWGYKIEAYDAIPQGPALMHEAGVLTTINSDSGEMMRRLYEEAAKSVRYAGLDRVVALQLVTLNGAKQLGIEDRVGSIEVGKDADLVLLNGDPLSSLSRVEWTMVEGEIEFQRRDAFGLDTDPAPVAELAEAALTVPDLGEAPVTVLSGGTIHTVTGEVIEDGVLQIQADRILAVGKRGTLKSPAGATVVDVSGQHVWPGMISLASAVGIEEIGAVNMTNDSSERGGNQPDLRVTAAVHPESAHIGVTRHNGVTRTQTAPQGGGPIRGQSSVMKLSGMTWEEMLTVDRDMLHISFPVTSNQPKDDREHGSEHEHEHDDICGHTHGVEDYLTAGIVPPAFVGKEKGREEHEATKLLRERFEEARTYGRIRDAAAAGLGQAPTFDPRLDALVPFARGEKKVGLHAQNAQTILFAVKFAREENLDVVIYGGREAWKVVDVLATAQIPVVIGPIWALPYSAYDPYDACFANAAVLARAGVPFAIMTADGENERNLAFHAAKAAAFGLPVEEAVRAVTYYPARILGLEDQLGSLVPGKLADVVVTDGDLLEIDAPVTHLWIGGEPIDLMADKQSQLYLKYRERLHRLQGK